MRNEGDGELVVKRGGFEAESSVGGTPSFRNEKISAGKGKLAR